jgi:hypothetical protein
VFSCGIPHDGSCSTICSQQPTLTLCLVLAKPARFAASPWKQPVGLSLLSLFLDYFEMLARVGLVAPSCCAAPTASTKLWCRAPVSGSRVARHICKALDYRAAETLLSDRAKAVEVSVGI